ncbi:hypothetical protein CCMA1212_009096 [Trichoderma ghanense]|uniref:Uncharacterized protein n=1 Tax=Trichoderma ghanense TaxID=65468 RepID=A0ABY2GUH5_9HYPO
MLSGLFVSFVDLWSLTLSLDKGPIPLFVFFILLPVGWTRRSPTHVGPPAAGDTTNGA